VPVPVIVGLTCERLDDNMRSYVSESWAARTVCEKYMRSCYVPRFDFHLAASDYIGAEVQALLPQRLRDRLRVCPMGVDFEAFSGASDGTIMRQKLLRQAGGGKKTVLLLYAGRLSKEKNLLVLPGLLARLAGRSTREYRLLIAGAGPFSGELRRALDEVAPGRSVFLGHYERGDLRALYHAADIFIHPNPREPFGIAPLEAMAAGLPLVAPGSGGVLTYANDGNAWLAGNSVEEFAAAVESVHADAETRRQKVTKARRTAQEFSWTRVTVNYFQLYDQFHEWFVREGLREETAEQVVVSKQNTAEIESLGAR
jgi:glycosyltransferase involved in cell wall biosynthesis